MNDGQSECSVTEGYSDTHTVSGARTEADDYQILLNAVNAARTGLGSGEHDYDDLEAEAL